jgi:hypothetical protein
MNILTHFKPIDHSSYQQQLAQQASQSSASIQQSTAESAKKRALHEANKPGPGRPKHTAIHLPPSVPTSTSSSSSSSSSSSIDPSDLSAPSKHRSCHWITSPFIHDILHYVSLYRSFRKAVERLQASFPMLESQAAGRFADLNEATVRYWYQPSTFTLKDKFKQAIELNQGLHTGGVTSILSNHPTIINLIKHHLHALRESGGSVSIEIVRSIIKCVIQQEDPDLLLTLKCSKSFVYSFLVNEMQWTHRLGTTAASKVPLDWIDQGVKMAKRIAVKVYGLNISLSVKNSFHKSLLINFDQTGMQFVNTGKCSFAAKGSKDIAIIGMEDKRQITVVVGSSANGDMLPLQLIFTGKTNECHPPHTSSTTNARFHLTHSINHWSNQETMDQYVEHVLLPYLKCKIAEHNLPPDSKLIVNLDCWSVHKSAEFRSLIKSKYNKSLVLVYVPPNCTSKLQVADVMLQFPFKHHVKQLFNQHVNRWVGEQLQLGVDTINTKVLLKMSNIKPLLLTWCHEAWLTVKNNPVMIMAGWQKAVFAHFDVFDVNKQAQAVEEQLDNVLDCEFIPKEDESTTDQVDEFDEFSDDEGKDTLDIMKEIHHGSRRTGRTRTAPQTLYGYMSVDPTKLHIVPFDDNNNSSFSSSSSSSSSSPTTPHPSKKRKKT